MSYLETLREFAECDRSQEDTCRILLENETRINEALSLFGTGQIKAIQNLCMGYLSEAKSHLKACKAALKDGDKKLAKKEGEEAIKLLKMGRKNAEKIEEDGFLETFVIAVISGIIPVIGPIAAVIGILVKGAVSSIYMEKHPAKISKKASALEAYGIRCKEATKMSRNALLHAYDSLIDECETVIKNIK